ncbi:hypothetical protein [Streptomyces sp. TRM49041]|uniref:hypothetical protein n=1 Tax=Streptomyces sp. TRM49041 TaxID=2603216 RepID=UPI0011F01C32|nr:hypothetical protein [Streptomyces sp. TRM49041]
MTIAHKTFCAACDQPINGQADVYYPDSPSGAKPPVHYHPHCSLADAAHVRRYQLAPGSR